MTIKLFPLLVAVSTLSLAACTTKGDGGGDDVMASDDDDDDDDVDPTTTGPGGTTTSDVMESSEGDDSGGDTISFIIEDDIPNGIFQCDLWFQDCPEGEKCMPYASMGGTWDGTRCSPITGEGQSGDECTVEGNGASGLDSCDIGSMCWDVNPEDNTGTCISLCTGDATNPICENPDNTCVQANGGALNICLPTCQPLLQDCAEGQACYPVDDGFTCAPNANPDALPYDACEFLNVCPSAHFCANPEIVPPGLCDAGAMGCCSPFCDLSGDTDTCLDDSDTWECQPWFEEGQAPPAFTDVGLCALPGT